MSNWTPIFVHCDDPTGPIRTGHVKAFHKKSRNGCQRCRMRRVRCDQAKPICYHCERHGAHCIYDRGIADPRNAAQTPRQTTADPDKTAVRLQRSPLAPEGRRRTPSTTLETLPDAAAEANDTEDTESRSSGNSVHNAANPTANRTEPPLDTVQRHKQELELMHFFITETGPSVAFDSPLSHDVFVKAIPRLALKSDGLLYSLYAFSALHRTRTTGGDNPSVPTPRAVAKSRSQHEHYLQLAIQHHYREVAQLSATTADEIIVTCSLMRLLALVVLSERSLTPYEPPIEWLRITRSQVRIFTEAWEAVGENGSTLTARLALATSPMWNRDKEDDAHSRQGLEHLLQRRGEREGEDDDDLAKWDAGVREAYESALSCIGDAWQCIQRNEPTGPAGRRLILFPMVVDERFIDLVCEARPRALVILGHYFALLMQLQSFWFVGNSGVRETRAIYSYLPAHWQDMMVWPLRAVEEKQSRSPEGEA